MKKLCVLINEMDIPECIWRREMYKRYGIHSRTNLTLLDASDFIDWIERRY